MLTKIEFKNFKCFKDKIQFPFKQINLLTGINGRGKSTLLQALLLMRQSIEHSEVTNQILLNGSCIRLGNFVDVRNSNISRDEAIVMKFYFDNNNDTDKIIDRCIEYLLRENLDDDMVAEISEIKLCNQKNYFKKDNIYWSSTDNEQPKVGCLLKNLIPSDASTTLVDECFNFSYIHYISADRLGPQEFYFKSTLTNFPNVGAKGEFTVNLLYRKGNDLVDETLCLGENAKTLSNQTEEWLSYIFDGAKVEIPQPISNILEPLFNTSASKDRYKPTNVGFGYHCILPIIVSGLIARKSEILIVENPEAHLHPKAQSRLTHFLAKVSNCGVQVFIESHSDHILNALRIAVLDKVIDPEDLNILYLQLNSKESVVQIPVQPNGGIEEWPQGFFDQMDKDFERLFGI
ncbi:AAA family ATPase [Aerosakkonema funiforme]|uniref:AAA family ATPase n=1 Tax=Aerosakkonema funiforme TaxID=1246630 RepID=UPI0035B90133